jgi:hypothetical protein
MGEFLAEPSINEQDEEERLETARQKSQENSIENLRTDLMEKHPFSKTITNWMST